MAVAMLMMVAVAGAGGDAAVPPAPPPVYSAPPPPVLRVASYPHAMPVTQVVIRMTLGNQILWSGPLNIGGMGQSRVSLSEPVAGAELCDSSGGMRAIRQIELSVSVQSYHRSPAPEYRLSARYSRPADGDNCRAGSRSISIEQGFSLSDGKPLAFEGDGGLKVQISPSQ